MLFLEHTTLMFLPFSRWMSLRHRRRVAMAEPQATLTVDSPVTLTAEERKFLAGLLEVALRDTRVEEHRTRTPSYREHIVHHEELIASVLTKLGQPRP